MRLRFWRWAHHAAETLWHWIYYNRLPEGREEMRKAAEKRNLGHSYSMTFVNAKGEEVVPHSNGKGCSYLTHEQLESLTQDQKAALRRIGGWPDEKFQAE